MLPLCHFDARLSLPLLLLKAVCHALHVCFVHSLPSYPPVTPALPTRALCRGTYKATVKRGGDYTGGVRGEVSFNGDLSAPLLDAIAVDWDNAFGAKIEQHLR